jgi:acetolactate decarboxylase
MSTSLYMTSPINAIIEGLYEAKTTMAQLKQRGDFGIGTFNDLDGELVLIDGIVYRLDIDGKAHPVEDSVCTPFASICRFSRHTEEPIEAMDYAGFNRLLQQSMPSQNMFFALRVDASFDYVRTRSVPRTENYTPLVEAVSKQKEREFHDLGGSLVGFFSPSFIPSVNVPGLHFHFISDDRSCGGHLLECRIRQGRLLMQYFYEVTLGLPATIDYLVADFTRDSASDLEKAER